MIRNTSDGRRLVTLGIALTLVTVVGVALSPAAAQDSTPVVDLQDVEVTAGETATTEVTLGPLPEPSYGYSFTVEVANPSVATVTNASYNPDLNLMSERPRVADDGSAVTVTAADVSGNLQARSESVPILSITVEGQSAGTTTLTTDEPSIQDADGNDMDVTVDDGTVDVAPGSGSSNGSGNDTLFVAAGVGLVIAIAAIGRYADLV